MGSDFEGSPGRSSLEPFPLPFFSSVSLCSEETVEMQNGIHKKTPIISDLHTRTLQLEKSIKKHCTNKSAVTLNISMAVIQP